MAVALPNGVVFALGTLGSALAVSGLTNAAPAVATSTAHGLADGDIVLLTSGWTRINERAWKVDELSANTFSLLGTDTTDTVVYPTGTGTGTVKEVTAWTSVSQVTNVTSSGGDMQFAQYSFLEEDIGRQIPTQANPITYTLTVADDPSQVGYAALKAAATSRALTVLRCTLPSGSVLLYVGYVSFQETPTMTKNSIMEVTATFSVNGLPVRYA